MSNRRKYPTFFVLIAILLSLALMSCAERKDWKRAKQENTIEAYQQFLEKHQDGKYSLQARLAIEEIDWAEAVGINTIPAYQQFLEKHQDGKYSLQARLAIEEIDWAETVGINTIPAYQQFLEKHPNGAKVSQAKASIEKLRTYTGKDGAPMLLIPAGEFLMGTSDAEIDNIIRQNPSFLRRRFGDEQPQHKVYLDAFYIDVYEITNERYKRFLDQTGYEVPGAWGASRFNAPNQPVIGIDIFAAEAYCKWAGKRLPTEAEWEKAARGGLVGKQYPWGDNISSGYAKYGGEVLSFMVMSGSTASVGSYQPNGYGLYDMAGNVSEWCSDVYSATYYKRSPKSNPRNRAGGMFTASPVRRGGSWCDDPLELRVAYRSSIDIIGGLSGCGFRCAMDAK